MTKEQKSRAVVLVGNLDSNLESMGKAIERGDWDDAQFFLRHATNWKAKLDKEFPCEGDSSEFEDAAFVAVMARI